MQSRSEQVIKTLAINENEVYEKLCKINLHKACSPNDEPGRFLKEGAAWIADPLSKLFMMSHSDFEKGSKHNLSNYQLVSLTSLVIRTLEYLAHKKYQYIPH